MISAETDAISGAQRKHNYTVPSHRPQSPLILRYTGIGNDSMRIEHTMKRCLPALALIAALAFPALAAPDQWTIDPAHSTAEFLVTHLEISDVDGTFKKVSGSATIDDDDLSKSSVTAAIDVSSLDSGIQMRDDDLKSAEFFNVAAYPTMTFQSTKIWKTGDGTAKMTGNLTLHGVTKQVTFDVKDPAPPPNQTPARRTAEASATISRAAFGMTTDSTLIGDGVAITLDIQLVRASTPPAH
jgi:polyisoprenoid-binding protein YceI